MSSVIRTFKSKTGDDGSPCVLETSRSVDAGDNSQDQAIKPKLRVKSWDLPAAVRELRDLFAASGKFFDRGLPVKIVLNSTGVPTATLLTVNSVVMEAHALAEPIDEDGAPITLPPRVARMYLDMYGEWNLPSLAGICTAPLLAQDGIVRSLNGYDSDSGFYSADLPPLDLSESPTRTDTEAALTRLRFAMRTFPFADAQRKTDALLDTEVIDLQQPPGLDESAALAALVTAVVRPNLWLAPGFLVRAPELSGAGTGKGLLVRAICLIAFGLQPRAFTAGGDRQELDKRLAAELIAPAPTVFLDNVNRAVLRSNTLAQVLTERPCRVRPLGVTRMIELNPGAFVAVTGNGLNVSEDLARRFIIADLDAHCEDPEHRKFTTGFLQKIEAKRGELLAAALTIWRWGRQNADSLTRGKPLGSFEQWSEWCRDPLLALGCSDPVERIQLIKQDDPARRGLVELFQTWHQEHGNRPVRAVELAPPVKRLLDPQGRGRQYIAARLSSLVETRIGGFLLTRQAAAGKWGAATYALCQTDA